MNLEARRTDRIGLGHNHRRRCARSDLPGTHHRTGSASGSSAIRSGAGGVSVATWIQALVLGELWAAYGFLAHVQAEVVTNIPGGLLALVVVVLVAKRTANTAKILIVTSACGLCAAAFIAASVALHARGLVSVAWSAIGLYVPQLVKLFRYTEVAGVSL